MGQVTHICCPGPSFEWPNPAEQDLVVGVNVAITKMERCDVWVALGSPDDRVLSNVVDEVKAKAASVISMGENAVLWRDLGLDVLDWTRMTPDWFYRAYTGSHFSMFTALSWVLSTVTGTIHLWGCDLEGDTYCTGASPHSARWMEQRRWPAEFRNLKRIHDASVENEVDLRIHGAVARRLSGPQPQL